MVMRYYTNKESLFAAASSFDLRLPDFSIHLDYAEQTVSLLRKAGVPLLAGTDSPVPGIAHGASLHRELELLPQSGLSPSEALTAATFTPARQFGLHDRGCIAEGLRADLILVDGDPISAQHRRCLETGCTSSPNDQAVNVSSNKA
jgi:imidazolonepropionase-like amidohydrolase